MPGHPNSRSVRRTRVAGVVLALVGLVVAITLVQRLGEGGAEPAAHLLLDPELPSPRAARPEGADASGGAHVAWVAADRATVAPDRLPPRLDTFTDAVLVRLSSDPWTWRKGARVAFDIPHTGSTVESVIERVEEVLGGNRSYVGRVVERWAGPGEGRGARGRMVVTVGERNTFAYVGSGEAAYELVGNREFGWLMTSAGMDRHVDYDKPDYFLPGRRPSGVR